MAVGLRLEFKGATQQQYDATHQHMNIEHDPPKGLIFHAAGPMEDGWGVTDFWESREAFDRFVAERLQPAVQEIAGQAQPGPPGPPEITEFSVHNFTNPWLVRWGSFVWTASSPASARARRVLAWLSSRGRRPSAEAVGPATDPPVEAGVAVEDRPAEEISAAGTEELERPALARSAPIP